MWKAAGAVLAGTAALTISTPALADTSQQITVNGSGGATVLAGATYADQHAAYNQALGAAISDAQGKAQLVAGQLSLTLGPVVSFTEESVDYIGYCGFAIAPGIAAPVTSGTSGVSSSAATTATGAAPSNGLTPIPRKSTKHKKTKKHASRAHRQAHDAQPADNTCQLDADVTIVYSAT